MKKGFGKGGQKTRSGQSGTSEGKMNFPAARAGGGQSLTQVVRRPARCVKKIGATGSRVILGGKGLAGKCRGAKLPPATVASRDWQKVSRGCGDGKTSRRGPVEVPQERRLFCAGDLARVAPPGAKWQEFGLRTSRLLCHPPETHGPHESFTTGGDA